ncbi:MAG TPA: 30S ribosomal protein S20 [Candidatus Saccharimonadales bacterium]|nr:30S ribosomal protein S20 [Candidatus Saccharimonadales bacterium]
MPHHKSAKHRVKTNARDRVRNRAALSAVRGTLRLAREKAQAKDSGAAEACRGAVSVLDRAVRKGFVKKSTANRHKSRLARIVPRG